MTELYILICSLSTLIALLRLKSYQAFLFFGFGWSYLLSLIVAMILDLPLDVHSDHDSTELRIQLLMLFALSFFGIAVGALQKQKSINNPAKILHLRQSVTINIEKKFIYLLFILIIISELYIMNVGAVFGGYKGELKRGYFYEYFALLYIFVRNRLPSIEIKGFIFAHIVIALLAGERLIALTAIAAVIFTSQPQLISFKRGVFIIIFGYIMTLAHGFRTGEFSLNPLALIVFGEYATQQSSLLYSSVFLLDFASANSYGFGNALLYLIGFDGSQFGGGLADILSNFGVRGGAGLYFSYFVAIFGWPIGIFLTFFASYAIGYAFRRFLSCSCPLLMQVFLSFSFHAFSYSPVLFFKPLLYCLVLSLLYQIYSSILLRIKT